jgi:hypothetical protein
LRSWSSSWGRQSVDQFVLVLGSLWDPWPDFIFFFFFRLAITSHL